MRLILAFVLLVALAAVVSANTGAEALPAADIARQFTAFISRFKKSYAASTFAAKLKTFTSNIARIAARSKDKLAKFGITKFADLSKTEFKRRLGARRPPASAAMVETEYEVSTNAEAELAAFTDAFDWSARGVFPGVPLDQGDCGSCWAFTTAAVLDAARGIKGLKGDYVSPQALVDCARSDLCGGCDGGHIYCAATFTRTTGFFALKDKPYRGVERTCSVAGLTPLGKTGALQTISHRRNATAMLNAIRKAPVFGTIMAETLQFYESGILTHSADCDAVRNPSTFVITHSRGMTQHDTLILSQAIVVSNGVFFVLSLFAVML